MRKITFVDRLRYAFDNTLSRGAIALIGWLFTVSLAMIVIFSLLVMAARIIPAEATGGQLLLSEVVWSSAMHALDAGTVAGDQGPWVFRLSMFVMTLVGLFLVSILIGIITSGIEGKLEELRKGRSFVIEQGHTVILGWSPQIFPMISELVIANQSHKRPVIAILGDEDKVVMEDEVRAKVSDTYNTRIVCRTGNPIDLADLNIVNPHGARAVLIPTPASDDPDTEVIKMLLALTNSGDATVAASHIVAALREPHNYTVAKLAGRDRVELLLADDLIARLTVQTSLQAGLSAVYTELFDFAGDEIYFTHTPALTGKTFGEALLAYERATLLGLRFADGRIQLNPPMNTPIAADDKLILIAADDDKIGVANKNVPVIDRSAICDAPLRSTRQPVATLILGWNRRAPLMIRELEQYVPPGSQLLVVASYPVEEMQAACRCDCSHNQAIRFQEGDPTRRAVLDELHLCQFQHVLLLSDADRLEVQASDARTLMTLLHLRAINEQLAKPLSITSEMLDVRNRDLATVTRADDFIVSERLISLLLAQIAENKELALVFQDLFNSAGSEIYLKPLTNYIAPAKPVNFYTVVEAARRRGEVAIGYRCQQYAHDPERMYGVQLNPLKSTLTRYRAEDQIIVLAEAVV